MNRNIEVINPHLWAVKFSWLPWIGDITIERNPDIPPDRELARTTKEGILILNADFQHYEQAKAGFLQMQKASLQELNESWDALLGGIDDIAGNTAKTAKSLDFAEEDIKYMRDVAERDAINRYTTNDIHVDMSGMNNNISSEMDLDGVIGYLNDGVEEAVDIATEGGHK